MRFLRSLFAKDYSLSEWLQRIAQVQTELRKPRRIYHADGTKP